MEKLVHKTSRLLAVLASCSIVIMVLSIAADVFFRNSQGASLPGMVEIAETSLVIGVFFGLAWAAVKGDHVAVTLLTDRFNPRWSWGTSVFVWAIVSVVVGWTLYATTIRAIESTVMREERFGLVRWPMYPVRWVVVVGLLALLGVAILKLIQSITRHDHAPENGISESEQATVNEDNSVSHVADLPVRGESNPTTQGVTM